MRCFTNCVFLVFVKLTLCPSGDAGDVTCCCCCCVAELDGRGGGGVSPLFWLRNCDKELGIEGADMTSLVQAVAVCVCVCSFKSFSLQVKVENAVE